MKNWILHGSNGFGIRRSCHRTNKDGKVSRSFCWLFTLLIHILNIIYARLVFYLAEWERYNEGKYKSNE